MEDSGTFSLHSYHRGSWLSNGHTHLPGILSAAYFGFLESVYKKAMIIELAKTNLKVKAEKPLKVYYDKQVARDFYTKIFLNGVYNRSTLSYNGCKIFVYMGALDANCNIVSQGPDSIALRYTRNLRLEGGGPHQRDTERRPPYSFSSFCLF